VLLLSATLLRCALWALALGYDQGAASLSLFWFEYFLNAPVLLFYGAQLLLVVHWAELILVLRAELSHSNEAQIPLRTKANELAEAARRERLLIHKRLHFFYWATMSFLFASLTLIFAILYFTKARKRHLNLAMVVYFPTIGILSSLVFVVCGIRLVRLLRDTSMIRAKGQDLRRITFIAGVCGVFFAIRAMGDLVLDLYIYPGNDDGTISDDTTNVCNMLILFVTELLPATMVAFAVGDMRRKRGTLPFSNSASSSSYSYSSSSSAHHHLHGHGHPGSPSHGAGAYPHHPAHHQYFYADDPRSGNIRPIAASGSGSKKGSVAGSLAGPGQHHAYQQGGNVGSMDREVVRYPSSSMTNHGASAPRM
jgi:hypothetical protein